MKDHCDLHYFLDINEGTCSSVSLHLNQTKYATSVLECTNVKEFKPCGSPALFHKKTLLI